VYEPADLECGVVCLQISGIVNEISQNFNSGHCAGCKARLELRNDDRAGVRVVCLLRISIFKVMRRTQWSVRTCRLRMWWVCLQISGIVNEISQNFNSGHCAGPTGTEKLRISILITP
jgi:hypothetical protein